MSIHSHKKSLALGAAAFTLTLIAGVGIGYWYKNHSMAGEFRLTGQPQEVVDSTRSPLDIPDQELSPVDAADTLAIARQRMAYDDVLRRYRNQSIHVDENCRAVPSVVTVFSGARIMLDNQSDQEKVLALPFDSEGFILAPHHYIITNLPETGTFAVSCDNQRSVASIVVQKAN